jgi:8-hydroxy-5-deazaflavin:NADPH oxidoreductase
MRIAIIGMGNVGGALGGRWAAAGHEVVFGARDPKDAKTIAEAKAAKAGVASVADAAGKGEVVVLAVPWKAVPDALASAGDLKGKVVLDCTNPLTADLSGLELGTTTSAGEEVARRAPGAQVVKIFNTTGAGNMANPDYGGPKPTMLYAGDDAGAKGVAARLASDIGFDPVDVGPLRAARLLEPFALTWITLAIQQKLGPDFVFQILRRPAKA